MTLTRVCTWKVPLQIKIHWKFDPFSGWTLEPLQHTFMALWKADEQSYFNYYQLKISYLPKTVTFLSESLKYLRQISSINYGNVIGLSLNLFTVFDIITCVLFLDNWLYSYKFTPKWVTIFVILYLEIFILLITFLFSD